VDRWKGQGVTHVLVLADLPGSQTSVGKRRTRGGRSCIWINANWAAKTKVLKMQVQRSGIKVLTPPRAL